MAVMKMFKKRGQWEMVQRRPEVMRIAGKLAEYMIKAATLEEMNCGDDTCFLVYGIIRDCGYRVL